MAIRDNGHGFASNVSNAGAVDRGGFGLKGIAERVQMLAGTHTIESGRGPRDDGYRADWRARRPAGAGAWEVRSAS